MVYAPYLKKKFCAGCFEWIRTKDLRCPKCNQRLRTAAKKGLHKVVARIS